MSSNDNMPITITCQYMTLEMLGQKWLRWHNTWRSANHPIGNHDKTYVCLSSRPNVHCVSASVLA